LTRKLPYFAACGRARRRLAPGPDRPPDSAAGPPDHGPARLGLLPRPAPARSGTTPEPWRPAVLGLPAPDEPTL